MLYCLFSQVFILDSLFSSFSVLCSLFSILYLYFLFCIRFSLFSVI